MQQSPNFTTPGPVSWKRISLRVGVGDGFRMIQVHCLLCTLFQLLLYQLHLGSSGIRSQRLGVWYILPPDVGSEGVSLVLVKKRIKIAI